MTSPRLTDEQRHALALLANVGQNGTTRPLLIANGFGVSMINALVGQGLATLTYEKVLVGAKTIEIAKVRITEAGREVLGREVRLRRKIDAGPGPITRREEPPNEQAHSRRIDALGSAHCVDGRGPRVCKSSMVPHRRISQGR